MIFGSSTFKRDEPTKAIDPLEGQGPMGVPELWHKPRTTPSRDRYERFVNHMRDDEAMIRLAEENKMELLKSAQYSSFFLRCDRRALVRAVGRRVDLCMESHERDLQIKREKLKKLLKEEEAVNIRRFIEQAQAGAETVWQEKVARLNYLLEKRRSEFEKKYTATHIGKSAHVSTCLVHHRAKEVQQCHRYQMKETLAKKEAEKELDRMWHEVMLRECEALSARMEIEAIERARRDKACKQHADQQQAEKAQAEATRREQLKQEQLWLQSVWECDRVKAEDEERARAEKRMVLATERQQMIHDRAEMLAKKKKEDEKINEAWASLNSQGLAVEDAKMALIRRKRADLDKCNARMVVLREGIPLREVNDGPMVEAARAAAQAVVDKQRCEYLLWSRKTNADVRKYMVEQIEEHKGAAEKLKQSLAEQREYQKQMCDQTDQLIALQAKADTEIKQKYQQDLIDQIAYNKLLKERAKTEEMEQYERFKAASDEYKEQIAEIMQRPFFSEAVHPFMKQMAVKKLEMRPKCPCSKSDYCK